MKKINDWQWQDYETLGSTNDEICRYLGVSGGKFIVSGKRQTKGRGRRGRSWDGGLGNLLFSFAFEIGLDKLGEMIFIVSLSLYETIKFFAPAADAKLKWPNDVLLSGKKICGILMEKGSGNYLITGIGVNLATAPQMPDAPYPPTSLAAEGIIINRKDFLQTFMTQFDKNLLLLSQQGFAPIKTKWLQNVRGLGEEITVNLEKESRRGVFFGVDDDGALLLKRQEKIEKIYAGDIFYTENKDKGKE